MAGLQKSDAMLQHEKWISWVTEHNPKSLPGTDRPVNMMPETTILIMAFAAIAVVVATALSLHV